MCLRHWSVSSEWAVSIWGMLPTPCSGAQFLCSLPQEMGKGWWEQEEQIHKLQLSVLTAIYYTDSTVCPCLGKKVQWPALGKNILFFSFFLICLKNYVSKLFIFEPFSPVYILALFCSLYPCPVSFIRFQVFASCYRVIYSTKSMVKV